MKPLFTAVAAIWFLTSPATALDEMRGKTLERLSDIELSAAGAAEFDRFKNQADAFGYFYVNPNGNTGAWHSTFFTMEDAKKRSRVVCEFRSKTRCVPFARMVPRNTVTEPAVPRPRQRGFRDAIRKTKSGNYAAFAINGMGGGGNASNHPTLNDAVEKAMLSCREEAAKARAKTPKERISVFERAGLFECRIVHSIQKK